MKQKLEVNNPQNKNIDQNEEKCNQYSKLIS